MAKTVGKPSKKRPAKRAPAAPSAAPAQPELTGPPLREIVGAPPQGDPLAAISWMTGALGAIAGQITDSKLPLERQVSMLLKVADRMAKLQDPARKFAAEQAIKDARRRDEAVKPGPQAVAAPTEMDAVAPRRGRPPRGANR